MGDDFTSFNLGNFGGDKSGGVAGAGNIVKLPAAISDKATCEISLGNADGELIGEGREDGFCHRLAVREEVDFM